MFDSAALKTAIIRGKRNDVATIVQGAIDAGTDLNEILDQGMMELHMDSFGGKYRDLVKVFFCIFVAQLFYKSVYHPGKVLFFDKDVDIAAGAHPVLRIILTEHRTLQGNKRHL